MVKRVLGSYNTEEEAIRAVRELQGKGYMAEDLLLLSNKTKREALEENTEVEVKSSPASNGNSLFDKIKQVFTLEADSEERAGTKEKLIEFGLSKEQSSIYATDVEGGSILIAAEEDSASSTIRPLADPNLDPVADEERTDSATGLIDPDKKPGRNSAGSARPSSADPEPSLESTHPSSLNRL